MAPITLAQHRETLDCILENTFLHPNAWRLTKDGAFEREGERAGPIHVGPREDAD